MSKSDIFVIYDDAQFNKEDFQHRNKIRIYQGWKWLTVPVEKKPIPINAIKIRKNLLTKGLKWQEAHISLIKNNYGNTPYYAKHEKSFEWIYNEDYDNLIDLNVNIINFLKDAFDIKSKLILSSEFGLTSKSTTRLVEITEILGGDTYISGMCGKNYLDTLQFENKKINVKFQDFNHPVYKQYYDGFIPNMSAIDILFNEGCLYAKNESK